MLKRLFCLLLLCVFFSDLQARSKKVQKEIKSEFVTVTPGTVKTYTADGEHGLTYHVYIPKSYDKENPPPILLLFSPGGGGRGMINKFKASADNAGWIAVGCDKLSNSIEENKLSEELETEFMDDVLKKIPHDKKRVYLGGFSGGGMRAYGLSYRRNERFAGIISCGGWLGGDSYRKKKFCKFMSVAIINGADDKNANAWDKGDSKILKKRRCHVKKFTFKGRHTLPPADTIDKAIAWLEKDWKKYGSKKKLSKRVER